MRGSVCCCSEGLVRSTVPVRLKLVLTRFNLVQCSVRTNFEPFEPLIKYSLRINHRQ